MRKRLLIYHLAGAALRRKLEDQAVQVDRSSERDERREGGGNWKLILAYDGGPFSGWQVQPGHVTVQGELAAAIHRITGERVLPQGSGRTDAGVHALAQVASFQLSAPIPAANLQRALNHTLPAAMRVLSAEMVAADFHARHSARSKLYEYRIWRGEVCPPWIAPYVYACPWPLQHDAMNRAAAMVVGEHDFTSFAAQDPDRSSRGPGHEPEQQGGKPEGQGGVRRIFSSGWEQQQTDLLCYRVHGNGFLHHMVRNLVGVFLAVGRGHLAPEQIPEILQAHDRRAARSTAPARGLFLVSVSYENAPGQVLP